MANTYTNAIAQLDKKIAELSRNAVADTHEIKEEDVISIVPAIAGG